MSPFEYVSVLVSIIYGLGITLILTGVAELIRRWKTIVPFAPFFIWIVLVFVLHVYEVREGARGAAGSAGGGCGCN